MRDAGKKGLRGAIVRPGYVTAESKLGTTVTDDFLVRILRGCDQIHSYPDLGPDNYINCMPVDGVARICIAAASSPPSDMRVLNATARSLTFSDYLGALSVYGYNVGKVPYETWTAWLQDYVATTVAVKRQEHALLPLYHLAVTDLPNDSRSPPLNNTNVKAVLEEDKKTRELGEVAGQITVELVGRSLSYLVEIGFMDRPKVGKGKLPLPKVELSQKQRDALAKIGGRGAVA
jgi:L-aminoadipate-semialdehyde dehydrogenase